MATVASHHRYTYRDYLSLDEMSNVRLEFLNGQIYAMAGGTPDHARLSSRIIRTLGRQLEGGPCEPFTSDLRVRVLETGLATYPDVTVVCGDPEPDPDDRNAVVNPALVVEVTSDSTEDWDRGEKLDHYRRIPSLRTCVLVSHRERLVEVWARAEDGPWEPTRARAGEEARLGDLGWRIDVDTLYDGVTLA